MRSTLEQRLDGTSVQIGAGTLVLLSNPGSWLRRRTETIELQSHELVRRSVTVEIVLPDDVAHLLLVESPAAKPDEATAFTGLAISRPPAWSGRWEFPGGASTPVASPTPDSGELAGRFVVPLALLNKAPLRNFDITEGGGPVSLLHHRENSLLTARTIAAAAAKTVDHATLAGALEDLVTLAGVDVPASRAALAKLHATLAPAPEALSLAEQLAEAFLLTVELPPGPTTRIVTFGYDEQPDALLRSRLGLHATKFELRAPGAMFAASYHAELVTPDQLEIVTARMRPTDANGKDSGGPDLCPADTYVARGALYYARPAGASTHPRIDVTLRSQRPMFFGPALLLSGVTMAALVVGTVIAFNDKLAGHTTTSALFLAPGYIATIVLRSGEHPLVREVLSRARLLLVAVTLAAAVAAATLALGAGNGTLRWIWLVLAVGAAVPTAILGVGCNRALSDVGDPKPGSPPSPKHLK